ncbi:MAG: redoxin domain-containing protein [Candidatus Nanohaloarchaea archaeon]|nr:redoxin domain-containing protein [Candidatus Nanohaloarchaea archaeon]
MDEAPPLDGVEDWLNGGPVALDDHADGPVLLHFWRYASDACLRDLPVLHRLHETYDQLTVAGVHAPRFGFEAARENVAAAVDRYDIPYPVGLDVEGAAWERYGNMHRPRTVLVGSDGRVREEVMGAGRMADVEDAARRLLRRAAAVPDDRVTAADGRDDGRHPAVSPVVYAGAVHGGPLGNDHPVAPHTTVEFEDGGDHRMNRLYLDGPWRREEDCVVTESGGRAAVRFAGSACGAVLGPSDGTVTVRLAGGPVPDTMWGDDIVSVNGATRVDLDMPRLYHLVERGEPRVAELELVADDGPVRLYACTFR